MIDADDYNELVSYTCDSAHYDIEDQPLDDLIGYACDLLNTGQNRASLMSNEYAIALDKELIRILNRFRSETILIREMEPQPAMRVSRLEWNK